MIAMSTPESDLDALIQEDASFPWLTVRENVAFGLRRARVDESSSAQGSLL